MNDGMDSKLKDALGQLGEDTELRNLFLDGLLKAEREHDQPAVFRFEVRWPIVQALLSADNHRMELANGLIFEVKPQSRIEKAFLLSLDSVPDHVWEPQTTKLTSALALDAENVIVGGAYIGDQALIVAKEALVKGRNTAVHAFEPNPQVCDQLAHHVEINSLPNVKVRQQALWEHSGVELKLKGGPALTSAFADMAAATATEGEIADVEITFTVTTVAIDDYVQQHGLSRVGLIMLDMEGAEQQALSGANGLLTKNAGAAPHIVFEVYSQDWSAGLGEVPLVKWLLSFGYDIFAIRDLQGHFSMAGRDIEIIPLADVYTPDVPHGFNVLATKDKDLAEKYGLKVARKLSPKLLSPLNSYLEHPPRDPSLHLPQDGLGLGMF